MAHKIIYNALIKKYEADIADASPLAYVFLPQHGRTPQLATRTYDDFMRPSTCFHIGMLNRCSPAAYTMVKECVGKNTLNSL